jgi:hypothetical protein
MAAAMIGEAEPVFYGVEYPIAIIGQAFTGPRTRRQSLPAVLRRASRLP